MNSARSIETANALLFSFLTPEQQAEAMIPKSIGFGPNVPAIVESTERFVYHIPWWQERSHMVADSQPGVRRIGDERIFRMCLHADIEVDNAGNFGRIPSADQALAHLLTIRSGKEHLLWSIANVFNDQRYPCSAVSEPHSYCQPLIDGTCEAHRNGRFW